MVVVAESKKDEIQEPKRGEKRTKTVDEGECKEERSVER